MGSRVYSKMRKDEIWGWAMDKKERKIKGRFSDPLFPPSSNGNLYFGNKDAAKDLTGLEARNIQAIVHVVGKPKFNTIQYLKISLQDTPESDLLHAIEESNPWIHARLSKGSNVLVHCSGGCSRSPALVCAYLIHHYQFTDQEALHLIRIARHAARPNPGFVQQLATFAAPATHHPDQL